MSELAAKKTPIAPTDLEAALTSAWLAKFGSDPPTNAIAVLMSQSALETGSWQSCVCYNLGNVKASTNANDHCFFTTWENMSASQIAAYVAASTPDAPVREVSPTKAVFGPRHPVACFRAFGSLTEGAAFYLNFLATHYSAAWAFVLTGDIFGFNHALKAHGFYSADESAYLSGLCRMFDSYGTPALKDMSEISNALASLGYDTTVIGKAVGCFQAASGLVVDNTAGPMVRAKIRVALAASPPPEAA